MVGAGEGPLDVGARAVGARDDLARDPVAGDLLARAAAERGGGVGGGAVDVSVVEGGGREVGAARVRPVRLGRGAGLTDVADLFQLAAPVRQALEKKKKLIRIFLNSISIEQIKKIEGFYSEIPKKKNT